MNVVDSSGWLEYFAGGPLSGFFAPAIEDVPRLLVPAISILEVFKRVLEQRGENEALRAAAQMQQGSIVPLDAGLAIAAAKLGHKLKLPLADSVILATARRFHATLWTQDSHFEGLDGVKFRSRTQARE